MIAKLQGNEDPKKGSGLEYGYIDVRDEYREGEPLTNQTFTKSDGEEYQIVKRGREYQGCGDEYNFEKKGKESNII